MSQAKENFVRPIEQFDAQTQKKLFDLIWQKLKNLQFGSLEIVVHDSKVVQIERKEKTRF